jgi:hypothetical protein
VDSRISIEPGEGGPRCDCNDVSFMRVLHAHHNLCKDIFVVNRLYCCSDHAVGCRCGTDARHLR